jgi:hypothetical protein
MVRSIWKRTLVTSLAWAGLAVAQPPSTAPRPAPAPVQSAEQIVTLQEQGKPAHKCKIIKSWQTKEGGKAFLVTALDTGEKMTIVESGPITSVPGGDPNHRQQAMASRIYHWGRGNTPPAGAPIPPIETTVVSSSTSPAKDACCTTTEIATETPKRSFLNPKTWFHGENKEEVVVSQSPGTSSKDCVCTPGMPQIPVTNVSLAKQDTGTKPAPTIENKPIVAAPATPAQPTDWRRSWGKADDFSTPATTTTTGGIKPGAVATPLPQASTNKPDPLTTPSKYSQLPPKYTGYATPAQPSITVTSDDKKNATNKQAAAVQSAVVSTPATPIVQTIPTTSPAQPIIISGPAPSQPVIIAGPAPSQPVIIAGPAPGMTYAPVRIATVPDFNQNPSPLTTRPPQAPQPFVQRPMAAATQPQRPWMTEPVTNVPGMTNAFTSTPTPAMVAENANAFAEGAANSKPPMAPGTAGATMTPQSAFAASTTPGMSSSGFASASSHSGPTQTNYSLTSGPKTGDQAQMIGVLKDSLYPSQREYAAECLSGFDWHTHPQVVDSLLTAAKQDPAASVRAGCVRCLAKMHVDNLAMMNTLQALKMDTDPRVRAEAESALAQMK